MLVSDLQRHILFVTVVNDADNVVKLAVMEIELINFLKSPADEAERRLSSVVKPQKIQ